MTPTATYIAEENCLQELPRISKPNQIDFRLMEDYKEEWRDYNAHLATLRKIPCDPSCKGLWADGQKLVVGKDYEVREVKHIHRPAETVSYVLTAFPLVPVKSEEELWREVVFIHLDDEIQGKTEEYVEAKIAELKSKYSLTKR